MTIDGPSGGYDDDPQQGADSKPEKAHEHGRKGADILDVARAPDDPPVFQPITDGGCTASVTTWVLPPSSSPMAGSGQRGPTPAAREWSRTRRRQSSG